MQVYVYDYDVSHVIEHFLLYKNIPLDSVLWNILRDAYRSRH